MHFQRFSVVVASCEPMDEESLQGLLSGQPNILAEVSCVSVGQIFADPEEAEETEEAETAETEETEERKRRSRKWKTVQEVIPSGGSWGTGCMWISLSCGSGCRMPAFPRRRFAGGRVFMGRIGLLRSASASFFPL